MTFQDQGSFVFIFKLAKVQFFLPFKVNFELVLAKHPWLEGYRIDGFWPDNKVVEKR